MDTVSLSRGSKKIKEAKRYMYVISVEVIN